MIDKIAEELQKLPLVNKAAYRRFVLEKCLVMKETLDEFQGYVTSAKESWQESEENDGVTSQMNQLKVEDVDEEEGDEDDDEDEEDDEREYTKDEVSVVEPAVALIQLALDTSKCSLNTMTIIADKIVANHLQSASSNTDVEVEVDENELVKACQLWVANISATVASMESNVIDFGAELYPPIDIEINSKFQQQRQLLLQDIQVSMQLLQDTRMNQVLEATQLAVIETLAQRYTSCNH